MVFNDGTPFVKNLLLVLDGQVPLRRKRFPVGCALIGFGHDLGGFWNEPRHRFSVFEGVGLYLRSLIKECSFCIAIGLRVILNISVIDRKVLGWHTFDHQIF